MHAHLLVVKAAGRLWALPMGAVEQTFALDRSLARRAGSTSVVLYRGDTLELSDLAEGLGETAGEAGFGVVLWAGGSRRVFAVDELVGQMLLEAQPLPAVVGSRFCRTAALHDGLIVPVVEPGAVCGVWQIGSSGGAGFSEMQQSALSEIANIGSGHAATALSELIGKPIHVDYTETLLTTLAEAADRIGAAAEPSAVIDTPVSGDGGTVLLLFAEAAAAQLCDLLGVSPRDEIGRSALKEIGNILASSYLTAIVEMTGIELEPEPPEMEIDLLGRVVERRLATAANPSDPAILMRSSMTIETSEAAFSFLFVPRLTGIEKLLEALGLSAA